MPTLFQNFDLHGINLANRIVMAPMTRSRASVDNIPSELAALYYSQRASAGLIITEATAVSKQGCGYPNIPGIWNEAQITVWDKVTKAVHDKGSKIFLQIFHTGRIAHSSLIGEQPVSSAAKASAGKVMAANYQMEPYEQPRALREDEITSVVEQFRKAAKNAKTAGFDGIEIHAANGYLLDQFLRDGVNQRRDKYGGSIENRMRITLEVLEAIINEFGKNKVGIRFSPVSSFNNMSDSDPSTTFTKVAEALNGLPLAYIHVVESVSPEHNIAEKMRKAFKGIFISNEGITKELATKLVDENKADLVCFGSLFIANPDLVHRLKNGLPLAQPDPKTFYVGGEKGYIDYPVSNS